MSTQQILEDKLQKALVPTHIEVLNESAQHNVPPGAETHFKVTIISRHFEGQSLLKRHRQINEILAKELARNIHALSIHPFTESEWEKRTESNKSPVCLGGSP